MIIVGWLVYAFIYLGFGLAVQTWQIVGLYVLYGLYYAATDGVVRALIGDLVPDVQRGTAYGVYNTAIGIVALPASVLAGVLWQGIGMWPGLGPAAPFVVGALLAFAAVIAFARWQSAPTTDR